VKSQYDVIFTFATNVLANFVDTTCVLRDAGRAGGTVKQLRAIGTYKNKNIVTNYVCFRSSTMLTSKTITEIIENHSEFCGYPKAVINWFQVDLAKLRNYL